MINQLVELMVVTMFMSMTMGVAKPIMAQVTDRRPTESYNRALAEERIRMMRADPSRYEELPVTEADHEICKLYGYPKGARCKFRTRESGMISTFCHLGWRLE